MQRCGTAIRPNAPRAARHFRLIVLHANNRHGIRMLHVNLVNLAPDVDFLDDEMHVAEKVFLPSAPESVSAAHS